MNKYPDSEIAKGISTIVLLKTEIRTGKPDTLIIINNVSKELFFPFSEGIRELSKKIDIRKYDSGSIIPLLFMTVKENNSIVGEESSLFRTWNISEAMRLMVQNHCNIICEPILFMAFDKIKKRVE